MALPGVVLITGASSGIGAALAKAYANSGARLALIGRHRERLEAVAAVCRQRDAWVETAIFDVRDGLVMADWIATVDAREPIDLVIANAGILGGALGPNAIETLDIAVPQIETNFLGAMNTAIPMLEPMLRRKRGQIAFMSSLAALFPHPDWPAYCAGKTAILSYAMSLRERMRGTGVKVNVICPGWVKAPINDPFKMYRPFIMDTDDAARRIVRGLAKDKPLIAFPRRLAWPARMMALMPTSVARLGYRMSRARHRPIPD